MTEVRLVNGVDAHWDPCIRTIPTHYIATAVTFSHNGSAIAVVSQEHVKIFETATGVATFEVEESAVAVAFSPEDDMLVCGCENGSVRIWDAHTSNLVQSFVGHGDRIFSVVLSPCGNMIASGSGDNTVRIWDISLARCICVLEGHSESVRTVCWSGTGDQVLSGSEDSSVRVWDISRHACLIILRGHTKGVRSVASSCDSSLIASGSWDRTVKVYDARSGNVLHTISTDGFIDSVQFSTHGEKILYADWNSATIWDLSRKMQVSTINCNGYRVRFSPDGTRIASWSGFGKYVKIWDAENGYWNSETVIHHSAKVDAIIFAPDGLVMASWSLFDVKIWDTTSGDCLFAFDSHCPIQSIVFSPDSAFVVCSSGDFYAEKQAQVWDVHTRRLTKDVRLNVGVDSTNLALSPCGSRLVSQSSSRIILWDLGSDKCLARLDFDLPFSLDSRIAFAVDGTGIFIHIGDEIIQYWRISSAPLSNHRVEPFSMKKFFTSLPLVFIPMQEKSSHQVLSVPRQCCRYEGDEWILDTNGKRILWLPPDRRGPVSASKSRGKKIAVGTNSGRRVYLADFSDSLLLS
jgi:WD40 repeat protein